MPDLDLFISEEMLIAPEHPLGKNLELPLPTSHEASEREIRAIQQRDRIPGIVRRIIPFDTSTYWQYWWCVPGRVLLSEDVELLQRDFQRVEAIVSKLVWLWGGLCFDKDTDRDRNCEPVYDWQQVIAFAQNRGIKPDFLDVDFLPLTIKAGDRDSNSSPSYVAVEPNHWHIEFFQLQPTESGFELPENKNVCSCQIWTGKPFIKDLDTGEATTRYDLWVSRPFDLTIPPWNHSIS